ncbi:MAG: hypothetical protein BEU04_03890 [Marine Group III euryarchaeote CG-Bathy1]|uniref:PKD/Chitinase domain-containing protein n=1 Tax=Marine Group III euryarchaeote CG-Bathy1 TaxID=1889001 RepID=A0A1J5TGV1_9ARCH|nr:MAG: hypothetical protein BEU04_03890 [Marine Group III euryarchaeote CG-Bathy1]
MRWLLITGILILTSFMPMASHAEYENDFEKGYFDKDGDGIDDRMDVLIKNNENLGVIVIFHKKPTSEHIEQIENIGLNINHIYKYINAIRIDEVPANKINKLTKINDLKIVEWQAPVYPFLDTAVKAIKVRESDEYSPVVWDKELYGEGINVAVLDTGVDNEHETFGIFGEQDVRRFIAGINCDGGCPTDGNGNYQFTTEEDSNEDPDDFDGHGTHVASTVLGTGGDEGDGNSCESDDECVGVAPGARLIDMKVMADWGSGSSADINEAIEACIENVNTDWENDGEKNNGVQIMSMSLGTTSGSDGSDSQSQLVNQANAAGIVVVIAMGNDGDEEVPSPAAADWSVAVGAMDNNENVNRNDDDLASYSNYGPREDDGDNDRWDELKPSVVAPGSDIRAALGHSNLFGESNAQGWTTQSGTSMATPIVAGLAALLLEADSSLAPTSNTNGVRDRLQDYSEAWDGEHDGSASEPNESDKYNYYYGYGYIDGYEIVDINQPDAIITEISITPEEPVEGDSVTISVEVKNQGTMDIDSSSIKLLINEEEIEDDSSLGSISIDSDIIWTYDWEPDEGNYNIKAEVHEVEPAESKFENNAIEEQVSVSEAPADGVDLAIIDVWTDDSDPIHNEYITVYAKIKNQGTETATDFELRWYDDNSKFATLEGTEINVEEEITISGEWTAKEGESELLARLVSIEPEDQNSNNDERSFTIDVSPPPDEPDFSPANIEFEGTLEEGQEITINYEIFNLGKTSGTIDYEVMIDGNAVDSGNEQIDSESSEIKSYIWDAEKGTHTVKIRLDNSDPAETTEDNNEITKEIEIQEPKESFELKSISWNDPLYVGEEATVTVTVANTGGKEGTAIVSTYAAGNVINQESIEVLSNQENMIVFAWTPYEAGSIQITSEIEDVEDTISKYAYVQEPEEENIEPVALGLVSINGIPESNSLFIIVKTTDLVTLSGTNSYDSDGTIISYSWSITSDDGLIQFNNIQEQFDYTFVSVATYNIVLTVTDNSGDTNTWQGSIIVEENVITNSGGNNNDNSNIRKIGGAAAAIGIIGAVIGLRYFRSEEEDDFFEFTDTGPVNLSCPNCSGLITITTDQRPIQVGCPMCQAQFVIRE